MPNHVSALPPFTSVIQRFVQALEQSALRLGVPLPERVAYAPGRVAMEELDDLWDELCTFPDPLIGIRIGLELQVGHLDITGLLLMSCDTYGESLESLIEYAPLIGGTSFHFADDGELRQLVLEAHYQTRESQRLEAVLTMILQLSRSNTAGQFVPSRVLLAHAALDEAARYEQLLGCPVTFNAPVNALEFPRDALALPLVQANPVMRAHLAGLADSSLALLGEHSLSRRLTQYIRQHPGHGKERIAEQFHMSGRHLTRKLAEEGFSFRQLRDRELLALAEAALARQEKIQQIAEHLGFSDESAFAKAFRRWTGKSPTEYRG